MCFLLQNIGLKYVDESKGSIILNTESLWGAIFAIIILSEPFEIAIVIGGLLMFSAVLLDEINVKKILNKPGHERNKHEAAITPVSEMSVNHGICG